MSSSCIDVPSGDCLSTLSNPASEASRASDLDDEGSNPRGVGLTQAFGLLWDGTHRIVAYAFATGANRPND